MKTVYILCAQSLKVCNSNTTTIALIPCNALGLGSEYNTPLNTATTLILLSLRWRFPGHSICLFCFSILVASWQVASPSVGLRSKCWFTVFFNNIDLFYRLGLGIRKGRLFWCSAVCVYRLIILVFRNTVRLDVRVLAPLSGSVKHSGIAKL